MAFVVDASVAAGWLLPDEPTDIADVLAFRMQSDDALAPDLFWHEALSLLLTALRRGRIPETAVYISLDRLATIPLRNVPLATTHSQTMFELSTLKVKHACGRPKRLRRHRSPRRCSTPARARNLGGLPGPPSAPRG